MQYTFDVLLILGLLIRPMAWTSMVLTYCSRQIAGYVETFLSLRSVLAYKTKEVFICQVEDPATDKLKLAR